MPTKKLPLRYKSLIKNYDHAGPMPNESVLRDKFWGSDSICVWCGIFLYNLGNQMTPDVKHIYEDLAVSA